MARTSEGKRLTETNRVAQVKVAARQQAKARIAYRFLDVADLDASFPRWVTLMHEIVGEGFQDSVTLAKPYLQRFAAAEGASIPDLPDVALDAAKLYEDLAVNGPINIKDKIKKGLAPDAAKQAALERLLGVVQSHVLAGGRDLTIGASKYYGKSGRWRRVSDGQPCAFCAMLCARGPVYTEETVTFRSHGHCGCSAELVFGEWEPTQQERLWRASYDQAALDANEAGQKRVAPVAKDDKTKDTILWRMRRNAPELFSDGVGSSFLPGPLGKNGRPRNVTLDGTVQFKGWQARRSIIVARADKIRAETGAVLRVPPRLPLEAPQWADDLPKLRAKEWNHILHSDKTGGGHMYGYGWIWERTEFLPDWGPNQILEALETTLRRGTRHTGTRGTLVHHQIGEERYRAVIKDGLVATFHRIGQS